MQISGSFRRKAIRAALGYGVSLASAAQELFPNLMPFFEKGKKPSYRATLEQTDEVLGRYSDLRSESAVFVLPPGSSVVIHCSIKVYNEASNRWERRRVHIRCKNDGRNNERGLAHYYDGGDYAVTTSVKQFNFRDGGIGVVVVTDGN